MAVFENVDYEKLKAILGNKFKEVAPTSQYELHRLKSESPNLTLIFYTSNKLQIQGKPDDVKTIADILVQSGFKEKITEKDERTKENLKFKLQALTECLAEKKRDKDVLYVGSDESLKGDTFGGLTVAAVLLTANQKMEMQKLSVRDSKELSDQEIREKAALIKQVLPRENYEIISLLPKEYNESKSQTELLNTTHRSVFEKIRKNYKDKTLHHVVDEYPGCKVGDIIETKAESKYIEVAAASILARSAALEQLDDLSKKLGIKIPKGSTHVSHALAYLKSSKKDPKEFVKIHFSNVRKALYEG